MPHLILFSFLAFAIWLIRHDTKLRNGISPALWIPTLWMGIIASRPVSAWTGISGSGDTLDGSPADRAFFLLLILAGLLVLSRRAVNWGWLLSQNLPILVFYGFLLISVIWANSPFSSFKRWFKESGNIVMVLVILTDPRPLEAFRAVFVRCAYLLIPLSLIFIRYFPDLGRRYNQHSGAMEAVGVTFQKNSLGTMILACGLILLWDWLQRLGDEKKARGAAEKYAPPIVLGIAAYLIFLCDSKTSILSLALGSLIILSIRFSALRQKLSDFGVYALLGVGLFFLVDREFGISEAIIRSLGRDMTFTGRTEVWAELLKVGTDSMLGTGYMSFWDDQRFQSKLPYWVAFSAHNGYIEVYLAGGWIGIGALSVMILGVIVKISRALGDGSDYSAVRFAVLVMALIANFAESNFACMTPLGFLFILAAIGHARPQPALVSASASADNVPPQEPAESNELSRRPQLS